jgi:ribosomal protein S18 acetylase RimI-like enzyme
MPLPELNRIGKLPGKRWEDLKQLRLEALENVPSAFGSSLEEERRLPEKVWRERIKSVLIAFSEGKPVGMVSYVFNERVKTKHVAHIYGVYVTQKHRGQGMGQMLMDRALFEIRKNRNIVKVQLSVNPLLRTAVSLYKGEGFEVVGRARKDLKIGRRYFDLLLMEKEIRKVPG